MDSHSLKVLGFDKIRSFLKSFAASPGGKRQCEHLLPSQTKDAVESLLKETTEMREAIESEGPLPLSGIHDIQEPVERTRIQNFHLDQTHLLQIKETLETAATAKTFFSSLDETCPLLCRITKRIVLLKHITSRVHKSISSQGEILDSASPLLAETRSRIKTLRQSIIKTLENLISDENIGYAFQDDFITLRNNRYVVPVRSDSKTTVPGVVHDQSQTKATFFIEPLSIVNLNNELQILRKEGYYEELRILAELTKLVEESQVEILTNLNIIERIDLIHARALFSRELNAVEPEISKDGSISLIGCRHPILLAGFIEDEVPEDESKEEKSHETIDIPGHWEFRRKGVVSIDLVKTSRHSALIITGANAGGKTVAMKTLGLFVLMAQAGIHLPAEEESTIEVYEKIFADIGDEQNIETSLSTFSAHMEQIKSIIATVTPSSLVLLDELGSGTDPSEGGALAVSILDFLRTCGCFTVLTTHLNILKTYAYNHDDVENVSVEFDPATFQPTYHLVYGVPGISNALAIANNIGIPQSILENAKTHLDDSDRYIIEFIQGLEKTQQDILKEKQDFRQLKEKAQYFLKKTEALFQTIKTRKDHLLKNFEADARKLIQESEEQLMKLIKEQKRRRIVRPEETSKIAEEGREALNQAKQNLYNKFSRPSGPKQTVTRLEVGQQVNVFHLLKKGTVVAADNQAQKAEIAIGTMKVKTRYQELEPVESDRRVQPSHDAKRPAPQPPQDAGTAPAKKINVIGMRVPDALPVVDKAIDDAILQGVDAVEIIHGRGTGKLMKAIQEYLNDHISVSSIKSADASEGGSGVTIVHVK